MADQVYDPENQDKRPVEQKEEVAPSHEREIAQPGGFKGLRQSYRDFRNKQKGDDAAAKNRNEGLRNYWQQAKDDDEANDQGFFKRGQGKSGGIGGIFKRKKMIVAIAGGGIIGVLFAFSGLLSEFKMDHIMSNIDTKTFARLNASLDTRNMAYMRTYMELRLFDTCAADCPGYSLDKDNLLFKNNVVSRSNPVWNLYRTLRSSSFESDVFNKNGVFLASLVERDANGNLLKPKVVQFEYNGDVTTMSDELRTTMQGYINPDGTINNQAKLSAEWQNPSSDLNENFISKPFETGSASRAAVRDLVNANTQPWQVFKRRQLRKDFNDKLGNPKWSFFDWATGGSVTKLKNAKLVLRNRLLDYVLPSTRAGNIMRCVFGISNCKLSPDDSAPANEASNVSETSQKASSEPDTTLEPPASSQDASITLSSGDAALADTVSKAIGTTFSALNYANWASIINMLAKINTTISNGAIAAQVAIARGYQAMALYQMFETIRDQMKTGQVTADEVNAFMQSIENITLSEAWVKVVDGHGTATALTTTAAANKFCKESQASENEFAYLCNNTVIGGISGATNLQNAYNSGPGQVLNPLFKVYSSGLGWFGDLGNWVFGHTLGPVFSLAVSAVEQIPGVQHTLQGGLSWATGQVYDLLGAGPILNTNSSSGQIGNWLVQGGAFSAESAARSNGAAVTNSASKASAQANTLGYEQAQSTQQSFIAKYLSPGNPQSLISNGLFAVSQLKFSSIGHIFTNLGSMFHTIASALSLPFTHQTLAASNDYGYTAAEVAQIQTYDFPSQCLSEDPLAMSLDNLSTITNLKSKGLFPNADTSSLTWDVLDNSQSWYDYLYKQPGANDQAPNQAKGVTKAMLVYNCALLDNSVRGDLGNLYGYTDDNGYDG